MDRVTTTPPVDPGVKDNCGGLVGVRGVLGVRGCVCFELGLISFSTVDSRMPAGVDIRF